MIGRRRSCAPVAALGPFAAAVLFLALASGSLGASAPGHRREFANGLVLVNPTDAAVTVALGKAMRRVEMMGGGDIPEDGAPTGRVYTSRVTSILVPAKGGKILLR